MFNVEPCGVIEMPENSPDETTPTPESELWSYDLMTVKFGTMNEGDPNRFTRSQKALWL